MGNNIDMYIDDCMSCPFHNFKNKPCALEYDEADKDEFPEWKVDMSHNLSSTRSKNCPLNENRVRIS